MANKPDAVKDRIAKAVGQKFFRKYMKYHPQHPTTLEEILCKGCAAPISGLIEDDRLQDVKVIGGVRTIIRKMIWASHPNYAEITVNFNDGSKHVTNICTKCVTTLTIPDLEGMYAADLEAWEEIEDRGGGKVNWELYGSRTPVGFMLGG